MPSKNLQPAVWGGLFIGVLSALPIIGWLNACCCMWVIAGGMLTAYLMQQASPLAITVADGALGGLIAGLIGAGIHAILSIPFYFIMGSLRGPLFQRLLESGRDMPPELRDALQRGMMGGGGLALTFVSTLMLWLVLGAVFSTVGGMLGVALFSRGKPTIAGAPPAPPPPPASSIPPSPVPPPPTPPPPEA